MKGVPIKFRGKRVKDEKTVYGWAYKSECPMSSFPAIIDYNDKYNAIYPDSVAQLVSYDKDGNEVYEDDRVAFLGDSGEVLQEGRARMSFSLKRDWEDVFDFGDYSDMIILIK